MVGRGVLLFPFMVASSIDAKDLGTLGAVFPIAEKSLLRVIHDKLQGLRINGTLAHHQDQIRKRVQDRLQHPVAVPGIHATTEERSFAFDPSVVIKNTIKDAQGRVIVRGGTRINPLAFRSLSKPLIFVDGDDLSQQTWVKRQLSNHPAARVILVKGAPLVVSRLLKRPVYFDQHGILTTKLGIRQVPCRVTGRADHLWVEEVKPDA